MPGIVGKERVESERKRIANIGQPMQEMPSGVNHSANILKAEDWINPLNGYSYDSFNKDALLSAKCKNGKMVLPSGIAYDVVIFPDEKKYSKTIKIKSIFLNKMALLSLIYLTGIVKVLFHWVVVLML